MESRKSKVLRITFFLLVVALIIAIFSIVIKDIIFISQSSKENDTEAIINYLQSYGWYGALVIVIIASLQMVAIFIPSEFVQLAAGLTYRFYIAIPLLLLGIFIGASIIFAMVNLLKIKMEYLERKSGKIQKIVKKLNTKTSMSVVTYILFIMPGIPIGSICYFAATSKMSYRRYITICLTGVIPSILSSIILGNVMAYFLTRPTWELVVAVIVTLAFFISLMLFLSYMVKRAFLSKKAVEKPNPFVGFPIYLFLKLYSKIVYHHKIDKKAIKALKDKRTPVCIMCNHTCALDFIYVSSVAARRRPNVVTNRYYFVNKKSYRVMRALGCIPKKLFYPDVETTVKVIRANKEGNSVAIMPEGRLSTTGESFPVATGTAKLIKHLNAHVIMVNTSGAYFSMPKWAKYKRRGKIFVETKILATADELKQMSESELERRIDESIYHNEEVAMQGVKFKCKDFTLGLDGILYKCPVCGEEFCLETSHNKITCTACGAVSEMDGYYKIHNSPKTGIVDWYKYQYDSLKGELDTIKLSCPVKVTQSGDFGKGMLPAGDGVCELDKEKFTFEGVLNGQDVRFEVPLTQLPGLAFSCSEEFELYENGILYYFYPQENPKQCVKWSLLVDIVNDIFRSQKDEQKQLENN